MTEGERILLDQQIHDGIRKGQSVHHILATQRESFTICEKTVYRYVNAGVIRTKRGDMPRACMMRPRKSKNIDHKVDTKCRIGRNFSDFKQFCSSNPDMAIVEMDSVVGRVGGKVLLTLQFNSCGFMYKDLRYFFQFSIKNNMMLHIERVTAEQFCKAQYYLITSEKCIQFFRTLSFIYTA